MTSARRRLNGQRALSGLSLLAFIPYQTVVEPSIVRTHDGDLVTSWQIEGVDTASAAPEVIRDMHELLCKLVQTLARERVAFWSHRIRQRVDVSRHHMATGNAAIDLIRAAHQNKLDSPGLFRTDLYLSAVFRPESGPAWRTMRSGVFSDLSRFKGIAQFIESSLQVFQPTRLGITERDGIRFSEQLRLYAYLLNGVDEPIPVPWESAARVISTSALRFCNERLSIEGSIEKRHAVVLDLREYPAASTPGMLDDLVTGPHEVIETQSFLPLSRSDAEKYLQRQRNQLISAGDAAQSQISEIGVAIDNVASQNFVLGEYHYSASVLARSEAQLLDAIASVRGHFTDRGFQSAVIDLVPDMAWFAQMPGNFNARHRAARLSSRNFCALSPLHRTASGKPTGNPWGECVTTLVGSGRSPVHFNFHVTQKAIDSAGENAPGNTLIIGQTGSGKTVLELFLIAQAIKFNPRVMLFDKDRGSELAMRAFGADYRVLEHGRFTGINPLQAPFDAENAAFMQRWLQSLFRHGREMSNGEAGALARALETLAQFPLEQRRLSILRQNIALNQHELRADLEPWCQGGALGWAFDADASHHFPHADRIGIDVTAFFGARQVLVPVMLVLLHQLDQWLDGRPSIYVVTECWKALEDPFFGAFIKDKQKTQLIFKNTQALPDASRKPLQCLLLMDEFTAVGRIEILAHSIAFMAGYNLRLLTIVQSMAQLSATYGESDARTLVANHGLRIVFAPNELRDAREISELLGNTTLRTRQETQSRSRQAGRQSISQRMHEQPRALMLPQELRALGAHQALVLVHGQPAVLARKIRYFDDVRLAQRSSMPPCARD